MEAIEGIAAEAHRLKRTLEGSVYLGWPGGGLQCVLTPVLVSGEGLLPNLGSTDLCLDDKDTRGVLETLVISALGMAELLLSIAEMLSIMLIEQKSGRTNDLWWPVNVEQSIEYSLSSAVVMALEEEEEEKEEAEAEAEAEEEERKRKRKRMDTVVVYDDDNDDDDK
ncbi:hypothetical protein CBR_g74687 [Chara braunii]|uniref:Uncharacterized protein n=1 Tax=Chara braunii TaxID=69332 RepID=A0A388KAF5_CHABU|nr:hypothetical protein CBR_g74687 [Chara braunii]|eukprot:GBG67001.1 hypothetical protein CBR_g74687 [Chara braunii]